jgi:hypothetical protein
MVVGKEIKLTLPDDCDFPIDISVLKNDDIYLIFLIGIKVFISFKDNFYKDQEQITADIEKKIEDNYKKKITDYENEKRELNILNSNLKKTFEDETIKAQNNYCEKIKEGVQYEIKTISTIYENQINNLNYELKYYKEKTDLLQNDIIKIKIDNEKYINDSIKNKNKEIEDESKRQIIFKENIITKINEEYNYEIKKNKEKINELEKTIIKLNEKQIYNDKEYYNNIEIEVNKIIQEKEKEFQKKNDEYSKLICDLKEKIANNEKNSIEKEKINIEKENNRIIELTQKCQDLQDNIFRIQTEYNEYIVETEKEKNENLNNKFEKNDILLQKSLQAIEELKKQKNANNYDKGREGELYVKKILEDSFFDFENFVIEDTSKKANSGDYIMNFNEFTVLVDSKNYTNNVNKKEKDKLEKDIENNSHIKVAWIISLNTPIHGYSTYPVMYEIKNKVCYCYINSLIKQENPIQFLRSIWYSCFFLLEKIIFADTDDNLIEKYKKNDIRIKNIVDIMMKKSKERHALINQMKQNFEETDNYTREILSNEIISIQENHKEILKTWWEKNIITKENSKLKTKTIYEEFIKDENNKNSGINLELFKNLIKLLLPPNDYVRIGKTEKSDYNVLNVCLISNNII